MSRRKTFLLLIATIILMSLILESFGGFHAIGSSSANAEANEIADQSSSTLTNDTISIASFNIRMFSNKSRTDHELEMIADVLEQYDFIAIQELRDTTVLARLVRTLSARDREYNYDVSAPVGRRVKELYAFLYRSDLFESTLAGQLHNDVEDRFIREPYFAGYRSSNFDFIVLTIHVLYGRSKSQRRPEIIALADVFKFLQDTYPEERDILLVGDFNFSPGDPGWDPLKAMPTMTWLLDIPFRTTISDASLYDNFWFQAQYVQEFTGNYGVYHFDQVLFSNDDKAASLAVSDHRPVWASFRIDLNDDD